ncbi:uncharacterized protein LOC112680269 [Sipha flava]|uniref:Uncharacterized protein LOC112680269 n=2 Tax=Sipha flava TaxID=143950 RepID=A0A8B8F639_9HEMI|nr:uncharacterized protein LOC112680269 [Sipha flava]
MCKFKGNMDLAYPGVLKLDPKDIPCECDLIIYTRFSIDLKSRLNIDKELIQQVVALKKPVILELNHETRSAHWGSLLKPSKQYKETKVLRDFASANNISGFLIAELFVDDDNTFLQFNPNVGPNLPCYISQLKGDSNLIIGLGIPPYGILIKNTCVCCGLYSRTD